VAVAAVDSALTAPDAGWVPAQVRWTSDGPLVEWCLLGDLRFTAPFFEQTIGAAMAHPFNLLFERATPLAALMQEFELRPAGLIFHMSRCGSTLVSQMLASLARNVVLSEPRPFDQILRMASRPELDADEVAHWLRVVMAALGRRRHAQERDLFVKLEGWHILMLPLIRQAFPDVPWIFLYRDPLEVLGSLDRLRPRQMLPGGIDTRLLAFVPDPAMSLDRYAALVLAQFCRAAIEHYGGGSGLLVEYRELPEAGCTRILDHFRLSCAAEELDRMREAARFNAKHPGQRYQDDSEEKRRAASDEMRELAENHLAPLYARLEALRLGDSASSSGANIAPKARPRPTAF
jgi:hypothetical protein